MKSEVIIPLRSDAKQYFAYAHNLYRYGIYSGVLPEKQEQVKELVPDAVRTPGYPIFLIPFIHYSVVDNTLLNIAVAQVLMSTLVMIMVFFLARNLLPVWLSLCSVALVALSPHLVNANIFILTESLFTLLLLVCIWLSSRINSNSNALNLLLIGFLIALGSLVRPSLQYFIVCLGLLFFFSFGKKVSRKFLILLLVGFMVGYGPWVARNLSTFGEVGNDQLKISWLHQGIYPGFKYKKDPKTYVFPYRHDPRSKQISESTATVFAEVRRRFSEETWRHFKWYLLGKPEAFWRWNIVNGHAAGIIYPLASSPYVSVSHFKFTYRLMEHLHVPIILLGMLGSFLVWIPAFAKSINAEQRFAARIVSLVLLYFTFIHMIGVPFPRYSIPLRPLVYVMALLTVALVFKSSMEVIKNRKTRNQTATVQQ